MGDVLAVPQVPSLPCICAGELDIGECSALAFSPDISDHRSKLIEDN